MNLFGRRPLCVFCCLFFMASLLIYRSDSVIKQIGLPILLGIAGILLLFVAILRKYRIQCLVAFFCVFSIGLAFANSYFRVDDPHIQARKYTGFHNIEMTVLSEDGQSVSSSEYLVTVNNIDGNQVHSRCLLICPFVSNISTGDQLLAKVEIREMSGKVFGQSGYDRTDDEKASMMAVLYEPSDAVIRKLDENASVWSLFTMPSGLYLATQRLMESFSAYVNSLFDFDTAAMVNGLFVGDRSSLSGVVLRDFRRCGVSHLMAVSGLHFAILTGILDYILRRFYVPKQIRCVIAMVFSVLFLAMTGFALSACRSAIMLGLVYLHFFLWKDHDAPTALFVSMALIILVSPHSISDLGLWMSFLATLGLVTVFPWINQKIPDWYHKNKWINFWCRLGRAVLQGVAITLISNFFLLPIFWVYFGEVSLITVVVNLILTPLSGYLLPLILVTLLLGNIPLLGTVLIWLVRVSCKLLLWIVQWFSKMNLATVSLNTKWANVLIPIFTVALLLVLLLPLKKRKWITVLPAVAVTGGLALCGVLYTVFAAPKMTYYQQSEADSFILQENGETIVCDISDGSVYEAYCLAAKLKELSAVRIDTFILTHYHSNHDGMIEQINEQLLINRLLLPIPKNEKERQYASDVAKVAIQYGIEMSLFEYQESVDMTEDTAMIVTHTVGEEKDAVSVIFQRSDFEICYVNPPSGGNLPYDELDRADQVFFGIHGSEIQEPGFVELIKKDADALWVFPTDMKKWRNSVRVEGNAVSFSTSIDEKSFSFELP